MRNEAQIQCNDDAVAATQTRYNTLRMVRALAAAKSRAREDKAGRRFTHLTSLRLSRLVDLEHEGRRSRSYEAQNQAGRPCDVMPGTTFTQNLFSQRSFGSRA